MAELSADALAIVDRLKREGDLNRNSGTNSIRSVKIELSKFQDIFKTISTNISTQNTVLKLQTDLAKEAAEKAETQEQFKEIEPQQTKFEKDDDEQKSKLVTESENKKINAMGDAIASALSFKNLALAGAGLFVGYNFLKGFIDEKTGGVFTEFEKNIGPFAKSLPIIGKALTDFPGTLSELQTTIGKLGENLGKLSTSVGNFLDTYGTPLAMLGGLIGLLGFGGGSLIGGLASLAAAIINAMNKGPKVPLPGPATPPPAGQKPGAPSAPGPVKPGNTAPGTSGAPSTQSPSTASTGRSPVNTNRSRGNTSSPRSLAPTGVAAEQAAAAAASRAKTIDDIEKGVIDPKMRRIFGRIFFKALPVLGVGFTLYQAAQVMVMLNSPDVSEKDKVSAVGSFLGTLVGAISGSVGGAILGATFGGPWGALIGGVIGAGLGGLGGDLIGGYIARWAFGEERPSQEEIDRLNRQIGIDQYLDKVDARPEKPMNRGEKGFGARAKAYADWNAQYSETHNPDGTPKASLAGNSTAGGGRGSVVEKPGEREAYAQELANREAALKKDISKVIDSVLVDAPGSLLTGNVNRKNGLNTVSNNGGGSGGAVIINAPVSAPSSINMTNGGSSVNQLSISGGGGAGIGPSMLPYGLTNAYN